MKTATRWALEFKAAHPKNDHGRSCCYDEWSEDTKWLIDQLAEAKATIAKDREILGNALECNHCGCVAVLSLRNSYTDGDFARCMSCGFPGQIMADEDTCDFRLGEEENDRCEDPKCEECK